MKWFKKITKEPIQKRKGMVFHQEIQDISSEGQKRKEELFRKNLEERVEKKLYKIRNY